MLSSRVAVAIAAAAMIVVAPMRTPALAQGSAATATATPMALPVIPRIRLAPMPGYGPAPLTVGFFVSSAGESPAQLRSFRWNFGDGQVSTLPPIAMFHTYVKAGSYVVTVTATTTDGHQASSFAGVIVTPPNH
jgi:PKD repeat protein